MNVKRALYFPLYYCPLRPARTGLTVQYTVLNWTVSFCRYYTVENEIEVLWYRQISPVVLLASQALTKTIIFYKPASS